MIYDDILLIVFQIILSILLYFLTDIAVKLISNKWRLCYFIPAVISLIMIAKSDFEISMLGTYIGSVIILSGFIKDSPVLRKRSCISALILTVISIPVCIINKDYRTFDYVKEFKECFKVMKEHYILTEHKNIDWDFLYEKYIPIFKEADKTHNKTEVFIAWNKFCAEFNDGHVAFSPNNENIIKSAGEKICGNDYGLSLMTLSDGTTVAVNVDETLKSMGIHNGTVITSWNGMEINEVAEQSEMYLCTSYADKDNEKFYKAIFTAGIGDENVNVEYIDNSGNEKILTLYKIGNYYERMTETMNIINQGIEAGNMEWTVIDDKTACLRIKMMMYDSKSMNSGEHDSMKQEISEKVNELKSQNFENIIIDLRNNSGGSGLMVKAIAEIFSPEGTHYYCNDGKWDNRENCYIKDAETGKYIKGKDNYYTGENLWGDNKVVILVNSNSVSAADHLTKIMQGFENVTVMGFTETNGSAQGIGGIKTEFGSLCFSNALLLDENGDIFIDSDAETYESKNDIDIKIEFNQEAVKALFDNNEDYVLQKTLEYLIKVGK